ncbi:hypothetical protein CITSP_02934 [Citrobacter sp. T1.2D-1]|nr:hypothetical protein CITSP_02934 [Citrobacter sp. T1.2D-1]
MVFMSLMVLSFLIILIADCDVELNDLIDLMW